MYNIVSGNMNLLADKWDLGSRLKKPGVHSLLLLVFLIKITKSSKILDHRYQQTSHQFIQTSVVNTLQLKVLKVYQICSFLFLKLLLFQIKSQLAVAYNSVAYKNTYNIVFSLLK